MAISSKNSQELYNLIDKFNSKKYPIKFELRIIGDTVVLFSNKKERFTDIVKYLSDNDQILYKYKLYFEAFEEGLKAQSLKNTLKEL